MDIRQLEAFTSIVEHKSFSEAAKALYLTQPSVSASLNSLEKELQTKLVVRTTRSIEITPAGKKLYHFAKSILNQRNRALDELNSLNRKTLYISSSSPSATALLARLLSNFHEVNQTISYRVSTDTIEEVLKKVAGFETDIGIVDQKTDHPGINYLPLGNDELVIACPNNSYYADLKRAGTPVSRLLECPMIINRHDSFPKPPVFSYAEQAGIDKDSFHIILETDDAELLIQSVISGLGISVMSKNQAINYVMSGDIIIIPLDQDSVCSRLYLAFSDFDYLPNCAQQLILFLKGNS